MAPKDDTDPGHWFFRGVQSAIFYYVSLTPCIDYNYRRKRRQEAKKAQRAESEIISQQPGLVRQPRAFQTNEQWAEELILGPGPPKGWKGDELLDKLQKKFGVGKNEDGKVSTTGPKQFFQKMRKTTTASDQQPSESFDTIQPLESSNDKTNTTSIEPTESIDFARSSTNNTSLMPSLDIGNDTREGPTRPGTDRKISNAIEKFTDSIRTSLQPRFGQGERFHREDEILTGFGEKMTRMWNRATQINPTEDKPVSAIPRRRADTTESDRYDYKRAKHPEVNELHPPVVSQLPATREEASWMLLPPPSAAVMAGKKSPADEINPRVPLSVVGRSYGHQNDLSSTSPARPLQQSTKPDSNWNHANEHDTMSEDSDEYDEGTSGHVRHRSEPSNKLTVPRPAITTDIFNSKPRESWQFHYYIPGPTP